MAGALTPENTGGSFKSLFGRLGGFLGDDLGHRFLWIGGAHGKVVASTRLEIDTIVTGLNGPGGITLSNVNTGDQAQAGDLVVSVLNLTSPADASASFETTISVTGQIQQTSSSNLSGNKYLVRSRPQS